LPVLRFSKALQHLFPSLADEGQLDRLPEIYHLPGRRAGANGPVAIFLDPDPQITPTVDRENGLFVAGCGLTILRPVGKESLQISSRLFRLLKDSFANPQGSNQPWSFGKHASVYHKADIFHSSGLHDGVMEPQNGDHLCFEFRRRLSGEERFRTESVWEV